MAHVIAFVSSKGGTGKTTGALNLAVALSEMGRGTALVDLDPQGGVALSLAKGDDEWLGLADHLRSNRPLADALLQTRVPTLTLLPRGHLEPTDAEAFEAAVGDPAVVQRLVTELRDGREYVVLDTPSGLGAITRAALSASDFVLLPLQAEPLALRSFAQVVRVVDHVRREQNPGLRLLGILPTMVQLADETSLNVMGTIWSELSGVLDTCIPRAAAFQRASELGLPVSFLAGRKPPEARRFVLLAGEIEALIEQMTGEEGAVDATMHRQLV